MLLQEYGLQRPGSRSGRSVSSRASDRPDSAYSQSSYQSGVSRGRCVKVPSDMCFFPQVMLTDQEHSLAYILVQ